MAKKNRNTFLKRQKEIERVQRAKEKMAKRQGAKEKKSDLDSDTDPSQTT